MTTKRVNQMLLGAMGGEERREEWGGRLGASRSYLAVSRPHVFDRH